jgi:hypothetical protein
MTDRFQDAIQSMLALMVPRIASALGVYARWEYRVSAVKPGPPVLVSGAPVSSSCPFGSLADIAIWPGPDGSYALPAEGSLILVEFHDGSPAKPAICGLDPNVPPTEIVLGAGTDPIALSALVSGELTKISTALTTHVHAGVTTGVGTSGTAAPIYVQGSVASTLPVVSQ